MGSRHLYCRTSSVSFSLYLGFTKPQQHLMYSSHSSVHVHTSNYPNIICPEERLVDYTRTHPKDLKVRVERRAPSTSQDNQGEKTTNKKQPRYIHSLWFRTASLCSACHRALGIGSVLTTQTARAFTVWTTDPGPVCNPVITLHQLIYQKIAAIFREFFLKWLNASIDHSLYTSELDRTSSAAGLKWSARSGVSAQCNV